MGKSPLIGSCQGQVPPACLTTVMSPSPGRGCQASPGTLRAHAILFGGRSPHTAQVEGTGAVEGLSGQPGNLLPETSLLPTSQSITDGGPCARMTLGAARQPPHLILWSPVPAVAIGGSSLRHAPSWWGQGSVSSLSGPLGLRPPVCFLPRPESARPPRNPAPSIEGAFRGQDLGAGHGRCCWALLPQRRNGDTVCL